MNTATDWLFLVPNFDGLTYAMAKKGFTEGTDYAIGHNEDGAEIVVVSFPFSSIFQVKAKMLAAIGDVATIYSIVDNERTLTDFDTSSGLILGKYIMRAVGPEKPTAAYNYLEVAALYFIIESKLPPAA